MEARIEALTAEVRELNKECQVTNVSNNKWLLCNTGSVDLRPLLGPSCSELVHIIVTVVGSASFVLKPLTDFLVCFHWMTNVTQYGYLHCTKKCMN